MKSAVSFVLVLASYLCCDQALGEESSGVWKVSVTRDSMTDDITRIATVTNSEGFSLSVYVPRHDKGTAAGSTWVNFSLPKRGLITLDPNKLIMFRVDDFVPVDIADALTWEKYFPDMNFVEWQPGWLNVGAITFTGGPEYALRQLQRGKRLVARYYLFTGGFSDTSFTLSGAKQAISEVTGLPTRTYLKITFVI